MVNGSIRRWVSARSSTTVQWSVSPGLLAQYREAGFLGVHGPPSLPVPRPVVDLPVMSQPVVPEPCPLDLELRLEPGGRLVYVSDLHLTDTGPSDDFAATAELCELLDLQRHPGQVLLALGGDILDLLQVAGSPEDRVARVLDGPAAAPIGEALRRLPDGLGRRCCTWSATTTRPWPGTRPPASSVDRFGVSDFALHARVRVQRPGGGGEVVVVAEHGDALDRWNRRTDLFDPLDVPIGDHVVGEFVNRPRRPAGATRSSPSTRSTTSGPGCWSPGGWSRTSSTSSWAGPCATSPCRWCC